MIFLGVRRESGTLKLYFAEMPDQARRKVMRFRPAMVQTVVTILLLPSFIALGVWQMHRAVEKKQLFLAEAAAEQAAPQTLDSASSGKPSLHAQAHGQFDSHHLFLLDNRVSDGRVGYFLLAPLRLGDAGADTKAVLVNLGWVAQGDSRQELPKVTVPETPQTVTGLALTPDAPPFHLTDRQQFASGWPKVVQSAQPEQLEKELGYSLLPVVLYPDGSQVAKDRNKSMHAFGPSRLYGYAAQWFGFAAILIGIYLWHGFKRARTGEEKRWKA
jgi:surfeit locus 1 family protein